jgi:hypothetical protein
MTYRVHYAYWAAGGRLLPTSVVVDASDRDQAVEAAERHEMAHARRTGTGNLGYFGNVRVAEEVAA